MKYSIDQNRLQQFGSIEFIARQVVEGFITGLHKSPFHGFSVEFAEHRLYNTGESTKHIDWKLYGRTDKLFVKRYEEETNLRCYLVIDNSSSMYFPMKGNVSIDNPNKITFSVYAAAAIMQMMKRQRDAVGLNVFSDTLELATPVKSNTVHHKYIYTEMEKLLEPIGKNVHRKTFATDSLHLIAEKIHKRSLVILFSDMFETHSDKEELFSALQHLKHNKHEVVLFHITDKNKEEKFDYKNRPYRFIDMESGDELKLNPNDVKEQYRQKVSEFFHELKLRCGYYHIDFVEADINQGFEQILTPYLLKRQKLF
ncbi:MAG: DUF58 domain-containing protein [Bacteroidales bacterium]|nr:DUF58 domain-containing protein [Bacteroidales bacterium]MCF8387937.1 DUF58 domain-containing protein [Bacteroidales bacterium]MCF8399313.1 DUF58 domain-containing protein [Bacteroidales bacterium]